jgi:hypothetical protein
MTTTNLDSYFFSRSLFYLYSYLVRYSHLSLSHTQQNDICMVKLMAGLGNKFGCCLQALFPAQD